MVQVHKEQAAAPRKPVTPRGWTTVRPRRLNFRRSRFVAVMKVLLPAFAIAMLAVVAAWPAIDERDDAFRLDLADLADQAVAAPAMINPRLLSVDSEAQPFVITADSAKRIGAGDGGDVFGLVKPAADITLNDGTWWALTALDGTFWRDREVLDLEGDVNLFHDAGYEFKTAAAHINVKKGTATGDLPIRGQGPAGLLTAQGFRLLDRGENILFTGKARLTIFGAAGAP